MMPALWLVALSAAFCAPSDFVERLRVRAAERVAELAEQKRDAEARRARIARDRAPSRPPPNPAAAAALERRHAARELEFLDEAARRWRAFEEAASKRAASARTARAQAALEARLQLEEERLRDELERRRIDLREKELDERAALGAVAHGPPAGPSPSGAAPAAGPSAEEDLSYYYEEVHGPLFEKDPSRPGWLRPARRGLAAPSFPVRKSPGVRRVFLIGGSTMALYKGPGDLAWGLARAWPGLEAEVINCGMSGYDSAREALVLEQVLRLEPDAVVLLSGHNDFFIGSGPPPPRWALALARVLSRWEWFARRRAAAARAPSLRQALRPEVRSARLERLLENARRAARASRRAAAAPVFVLPPLADAEAAAPPSDSGEPWADAGFVAGWREWIAGRRGRAAELWKKAGPGASALVAAHLSYRLAQAAARERRWEEAARGYEASLEGGGGSNVCAGACRRALKDAALSAGAQVADAYASFRDAAAPRPPGAAQLFDEIHWNPDRHWLVTRALLPELAKAWGLSAPSPVEPPAPSAEDAERRRHGLLFFAVQKAVLQPYPSQPALAWLAAARDAWPSAFASREALGAAVRTVHRRVESGRPGAYRSALPPPPEAGLLAAYLGALALEDGDCARARRELSAAGGAGDRLELMRAAAAWTCGDAAEGRRHLELAASRGLAAEAEAFGRAFGRREVEKLGP